MLCLLSPGWFDKCWQAEFLFEQKMKTALLIEGIPAETPQKDIEDFFSSTGPVKKCFQWQGFWMVEFVLPRDAKKASKTVTTFKDNIPIKLNANVTRRLILRNLPFTLTVDELKTFCTTAGIVMSCQLMKGFGFVQYVTHTQAKKVSLSFNWEMLTLGTGHWDFECNSLERQNSRDWLGFAKDHLQICWKRWEAGCG